MGMAAASPASHPENPLSEILDMIKLNWELES
jgi:hypothetical protein